MDETDRQLVTYDAIEPEIYVSVYPAPAYMARIGLPPLVPRSRPTRRSTRGWKARVLALIALGCAASAILWPFQHPLEGPGHLVQPYYDSPLYLYDGVIR